MTHGHTGYQGQPFLQALLTFALSFFLLGFSAVHAFEKGTGINGPSHDELEQAKASGKDLANGPTGRDLSLQVSRALEGLRLPSGDVATDIALGVFGACELALAALALAALLTGECRVLWGTLIGWILLAALFVPGDVAAGNRPMLQNHIGLMVELFTFLAVHAALIRFDLLGSSDRGKPLARAVRPPFRLVA